MNVLAQFDRGRNRVQRCAPAHGIVVFADDKNCHDQITLATFRRLPTSSPAVASLMPAWRLGGSASRTVRRRGAMSTSSVSARTVSNVFFLAFRMFGSET